MTPTTVGLVLFLCVVVLAAAFLVPAYLRQRIDWKRTPNGYRYSSFTPIDPSHLDARIRDALFQLRRFSDVEPHTLDKLATNMGIVVQRVDKWHSPQHGTAVAGVSYGLLLHVGTDLKALCHEMAHACEFLEGGRAVQDEQHVTWARRGFDKAVEAYEAGEVASSA